MCSSRDMRNLSGELRVVRNSSSGAKSLKRSSGISCWSFTRREPTRTTGVLKASWSYERERWGIRLLVDVSNQSESDLETLPEWDELITRGRLILPHGQEGAGCAVLGEHLPRLVTVILRQTP